MLFLQSDCDLHVYASGDYRAFKTILAGESKAYFKLYSKLGHNFTKLYTKNIMEEPKLLEISVGVEKIVINDIVGFIKMISRGQFWN